MLHSNRSQRDNRRSAQRSEGSFGQGLCGTHQLTTSVESELSLTYYKILQLHANVKKIFLPGLLDDTPLNIINRTSSGTQQQTDDFIGAVADINQKGVTNPDENIHGCKGFWEKIQEIEENNTSVIFQIYFLISRLCLFEKGNKKQIQKWVEYKYKTAYNSIINNIFLSDEIKEEITVIFQKTQRTYFALKRFLHIYTFKKTTTKINTDLCLNPIDPFQKNKIEIIQKNAKYLFTTADILNLTMVGLINSQDFFAEPRLPKNPYTNIPFTKTDMYNIYFHVVNTRFITPPLLTEFFLNHFELDNFLINNETKLRNISIKDYVLNSPSTELYSDVKYMIRKYFNNVQKIEYKTQSSKNKKKKRVYHTIKVHIVIDQEFPKEKLVDIMRPYLYLYILSTDHISGTEKKLIAKTLFKHQVKKFMKYNYKFGRKQFKIPTKNYFIPSHISGNTIERIEVFEESTHSHANFSEQNSDSLSSIRMNDDDVFQRTESFEVSSRDFISATAPIKSSEGNKENMKMVSYFNDCHEHFTIYQADEMFSTNILLLNKDDTQSDDESVSTASRDNVFDRNYEEQFWTERQTPYYEYTYFSQGSQETQQLTSRIADRPQDATQNSDSLSLGSPTEGLSVPSTIIPFGSDPPEVDSTLDGFAVLMNPETNESLIEDFANILMSIENNTNYYETTEIRNTELLLLPYNSDNESTGYDSNS